MPRSPRLPVPVLLAGLLCVVPAPAAEPVPTAVDVARSAALFQSHVGPLLKTHCLRCHGGKKTEGGLDLSSRDSLMKGGDGGPAVVPGSAKKSLLYQLAAHIKEPHMPDGGDKLPAADLAKLAEWIDLGAAYDSPLAGAKPAAHWAFRAVNRPAVPPTGNPIDHFIRAKLRDGGLSLNPEADRRTLIRRLKFDLLGLPPTPEEVDEFAADASPDAYEKLVDRYLASPHYGERWARHWLDAVRFAESNGFETNQPRPNAWPYRDWVIKSLNDDKPFDQFVREQLAGDTLGADAATGFLVGGAWDAVKSPDVALTAQQRADELHDMVSTTGSAFLGLTVGCARCHAHKFDPIPQLDYYRIKAVFAGVQHGERPLRTTVTPEMVAERQRVRDQLAVLESRLAAMEPLADPAATEPRRAAVSPKVNVERFRPVRAKFVRLVIFATNQLEPCIDELEVFTAGPRPVNVALASGGAKATSAGDYPPSEIHRLEHVNDGRYGNGRSWISNTPGRGRVGIEFKEPAEIDRVVWGRDRQERFTDRTPTRYRIDVSLDRETWVVVASSDDRLSFGLTADGTPAGFGFFERVAWERLSATASEARSRLALLEGTRMVYAGRFTAPEPTHRLHRGDPMQQKETVGPGVLSEITPKFTIPENATDAERRAAFAEWVTDPANPLTARVIVNRLWHYHFGTGIVDTPSDFGRNGGKPTHPELLDWLAGELMSPANGRRQPAGAGGEEQPADAGRSPAAWSLKHLHRLIVTSVTYRQSSAVHPDGLAKDAQTRLLWRYPPRRLEAESLRDSILFVSGKLDLTTGGPGFDLFEPNTNYVKVYNPKSSFGPAEFRRMVYQQKPRMQLDDTFGPFDCPDAGQIAPKRNVSTTPLQALNLLNSTFAVQQAGFLAERVQRVAGKDVPAQVRQVFRLAFQRVPTAKEQAAAEKLVREHGLPALCRAALNANEFVFVD